MLLKHRIRMAILAGTAIVLAACSDSLTGVNDPDDDAPPPALNQAITTFDAVDRIQLTSQADATYPTQLNVCLEIRTSSGWWKGLGVGRTEPTVEGEGQGNLVCARAEPGTVTFNFWKARFFGIHSWVGATEVNLSAYAGHKILFTWQQD
jgi:hypothetical protein